jgi:mono/diheme cytochrome c family protein
MLARSLLCRRLLAPLGLAAAVLALARPVAAAEPPPDFNRQVLPILADNCFACHGPDARNRKAKLRLDTKDGIFGKLRTGGRAVVPGQSSESVLIERVTEDDPRRIMPPPRTHKHLKPEQIALLKRWIDQGAPWTTHWAWIAPRRPPLPKVKDAAWPRNEIDAFILARLEKEGLHPSPEADRITLIRRVTLDLTGLPPTPTEVDAFVHDPSPDAYVKVVDRLLDSPRYGEHMARYWLDAARYGDTHGLHLDNYREMWPYRDWVIEAFNRNLPYDQFVLKQIAGDLLPGATLDDEVASGFNRCHVTTSEGGSIDEEVYVRNVDDRVDTTGTVLLGLTIGCAKCHDHKYDPIRQRDYYSLFAFLNSLDDKPLDGNAAAPPPIIRVGTPNQLAALAKLDERAAEVRRQIAEAVAKVPCDEAVDGKEAEPPKRAEYVWIDDDLPPGAKPSSDGGVNGHWTFVTAPGHPVYSGTRASMRTATGLSQHFFEGAQPGLRVGPGDTLFAYVYLDPARPPKEIMLQWNNGEWRHRAYWGENRIAWGADNSPERRALGPLPPAGKWVRLEVDAATVGLMPGTVINGWAFTQFDGTVYWDRAGIVTRTPQGNQSFDTLCAWLRTQKATSGAGLPPGVKKALKVAAGKRNATQTKQLRDYFVEHAYAKAKPTFEPLHKTLAAIDRERERLDRRMPTTLVSKERPVPRPAFVLTRGEYDRRGEPVGRATPGFLPPMPQGAPLNRLGLARWLVSPDNPLTARVIVNRYWQHFFGTGIVKTAEDFGTQGDLPSHPELLDWLAVQFREDGWDVKKMMKRLVTSATYRQSSRATPDRLAKDPADRLLSRGPRFRLDAETLRDQALFVSGLLVERVGGPSVKPPQPRGLWEAVAYSGSNTAHFTPDHGDDKVHRRSVYTFWKRTAAPPQMTTLDAPSRESCCVRRERTDTPLQALLLLNETQFVECARALAERTLREGGPTPEERVTYLFRLSAARRPDAREVAELVSVYRDNLATYTQDVDAARKLIAVGESKPDTKLNPSEVAAWTMVANLVLNLDEVLNKN